MGKNYFNQSWMTAEADFTGTAVTVAASASHTDILVVLKEKFIADLAYMLQIDVTDAFFTATPVEDYTISITTNGANHDVLATFLVTQADLTLKLGETELYRGLTYLIRTLPLDAIVTDIRVTITTSITATNAATLNASISHL